MHPLFAQLLRRRAARHHEPLPGYTLRTTLPPSREMAIRRPGSRMVLFMSPPPRPVLRDPRDTLDTLDTLDIVLEDLQVLAPSPEVPEADAALPARAPHAGEPDGVHLRIDPQDHQRVRISGSMREVCAALDALIAVQ